MLQKNTFFFKFLHLFSGISILFYLGYNFTHHLEQYMDIDLGDELSYISAGKNTVFFASRILYPMWYKLLGVFTANNIDLFYLNQKTLIILLPICLFIFLSELFGNFIISLFLSCIFLYSNTNVATEFIYNNVLVAVVNNKLNNFTLCIILFLGYGIQLLYKKGWNAIPLFTISFFILSYCRNEYGLLFILFTLMYIYKFFIEYKYINREKYLFFAFTTSTLTSIKLFGLSVFASSYSNLHYLMSYSRNYLERNHMPMNAEIDIITPCLKIFGNQKTIFGFFNSNPFQFTDNILYNTYNMFIINLFRIADILTPQVFINYRDKDVLNYIIAMLFIISIIISIKKIVYGKIKITHTIKVIIIFNILLLITTIISNLLYYFDPRYYIFFVPVIMISILLLLKEIKAAKYILSFLLLILVFEKRTAKEYMLSNNYPVMLFIKNSSKIIQDYMSTNKKNKIVLLANNGKYDVLIPGVMTSEYNLFNMQNDSLYADKYTKLDTFDIFIVNEIKPRQNYLWFNRVTQFLETNKDSFNCITYKYPTFTGRIYLKKDTFISGK